MSLPATRETAKNLTGTFYEVILCEDDQTSHCSHPVTNLQRTESTSMSATPKKKSAKSAAKKVPATAKAKSAKKVPATAKVKSTKSAAKKVPATAKAKSAAPAKPKPARPGKASAAAQTLTVEALLDRSRKAAGSVERLRESAAIEEAARRCVAAGRPELAASLAQGLRADLRAPTLAIAAAAGAGSVDAALDAFVKSAAKDPRGRPLWAANAVEALALVGAGGRGAALEQLVDAVIDEAFAGEPEWGESDRFTALVPLLRAQVANGAAKSVRRTLDRWLREDPESLGEVLQYADSLLWIAVDDPKTTLALINAIEAGYRHIALKRGDGVRACATWAREHLDTLVALESDAAIPLGRHLLAAGRDAEARHVLAPRAEEEPLASELVERHLLLGEIEAAKRLARDPELWPESDKFTLYRIRLGVETVAQARERLRQLNPRTGGSVMAQVGALSDLAGLALERGEHAELDPILAAIEGLLASKKRTQYDVGIEASMRSQLADLRLRIVAAQGDRSAVAAALEADLADLPRIQAYAKDTYGKNAVTSSLVHRAMRHGQPELALKAARKVTPADRHTVARQVAAAFLPADPGGALAALDALAGDKADSMLLARPPDGTGAGVQLLPSIWSAVLSQATGQGAA
ncbi:hypothetical protein [Nannocystis bainbridge]|uniref:HEAT repeat domain-containing protein n=1 Tax=Nannocystis bainbridge TaxID=2995303 RepID=A0ABT5DRZ4_9BACT|nr:hypothetical protein [Nannocystis bainbridge]MDC0716429.1 hypothetical protein [Nannocystis bainbridge]